MSRPAGTLAYLAVFAAAGRRRPGSRRAARPAVIDGIVLARDGRRAATRWPPASGPASLGENEISNRIGQPFEYWNAVGTTAALAIAGPALARLAPRRPRAGRVLAYPAMGVSIVAHPPHPVARRRWRPRPSARSSGCVLVPLRLRGLPV